MVGNQHIILDVVITISCTISGVSELTFNLEFLIIFFDCFNFLTRTMHIAIITPEDVVCEITVNQVIAFTINAELVGSMKGKHKFIGKLTLTNLEENVTPKCKKKREAINEHHSI